MSLLIVTSFLFFLTKYQQCVYSIYCSCSTDRAANKTLKLKKELRAKFSTNRRTKDFSFDMVDAVPS